jgi:hypothetical protein
MTGTYKDICHAFYELYKILSSFLIEFSNFAENYLYIESIYSFYVAGSNLRMSSIQGCINWLAEIQCCSQKSAKAKKKKSDVCFRLPLILK